MIGHRLPLSYRPLGFIGKKFRYFCAARFIKSIGHNVNIEKGASFANSVTIGDNSGIGVNAVLTDEVYIGKNVMMGPDCMIYTSNHKFMKETRSYEGFTQIRPVIIEDDVWIGARCIILPGVKIGKGSTIGAGSVVSKEVPPYSVVAGNPARVVKSLIE